MSEQRLYGVWKKHDGDAMKQEAWFQSFLMKGILLTALVVMVTGSPLSSVPRAAAAEATPTVAAILEGVQQRYAADDFEADFVQESHLKAMAIVDTAKGHVCFKPPFMMRWHYQEPEEYTIITDGETVWIHRPLDRQVFVGKAADYFGDTSFTEFFSEPSKLLDRFAIEIASLGTDNKENHVLRLAPQQDHMNVQEIFLTLSKKTFDIVQSDTINAFGDRTKLRFSHFTFNQGLAPSLFQFEIPKGTDVLQLDQPF